MMTKDQIENWKKVLPALGIDPTYLSDEDINKLKDKFQNKVDAISAEDY